MALPKRFSRKSYWLSMAVGVIAAYGLVYIAVRLIDFRTLNLDNKLAVVAAYIYLVTALMMAVTYSTQPEAETGAARPSWRHKASTVASFLVTGLALIIPVIGPNYLPAEQVFIIFLLCTGTVVAANRYFVRYGDELMRQAMVDMYALSYRIGSALLLLYGAAWALGLRGVGPWGLAAIMMIIHMACGIWAGGRRGFGQVEEEA